MFIGVYNLSVLFSYLGLLMSFISCYFVFNGNIKLSMLFFLFIGLIDMLDGKVARSLKRNDFEKKFGVQIDTVLDVFNFAAVPIIILYLYNFNTMIDIPFLLLYSFCATMRLAYFNTTIDKSNDSSIYYGFPTTTIALYLPLMILVHSLLNNNVGTWIIRGMLT